MDPYDIEEAFAAIEEELIASMMRNMKRHRIEEITEDKQWEMWQALQLKSLEQYKKANRKKFSSKFSDINTSIGEIITKARKEGSMGQEIEILEAIKNGFKGYHHSSDAMTAQFFKLNTRKLEALTKATRHDLQKAEHAILRMADDQYRQSIYKAQVYANTGAGTYEQAVDMATKDMLSRGLNCVEYANGARYSLAAYAGMALRTASKRAYLTGEGEKRKEWGITTVIVNKRGNPCPLCLPFVGKVLIDDVWSGGKASDGPYPLMSTATAAGLYHPNCKDSHTTYFEGISTPPDDKFTKKELADIEKKSKQDAKKQHAKRQEERFDRMAMYSLDDENKRQYGQRSKMWRRVRFRTGDMTPQEYAESKRPLGNFRAVPQSQVVDTLRKEAEEWVKELTDAEKSAIKKYTYNAGDRKPDRFFEKLNAMLRGDSPEDKKLKLYADTISGALKKNKLKHDVVCYRGMEIDPSRGIPELGLFRSKQFFSTSVIESHSFDAEYKIKIYAKKGTSAAYIENLSHFKLQRELLLDKDCIYRVLSRKENVIELEVI